MVDRIETTQKIDQLGMHWDYSVKPDAQNYETQVEGIDVDGLPKKSSKPKSIDFGLGSTQFALSTISSAKESGLVYELLERAKSTKASTTQAVQEEAPKKRKIDAEESSTINKKQKTVDNDLWNGSTIDKSKTGHSESVNVAHARMDRAMEKGKTSIYDNTTLVQNMTAVSQHESSKVSKTISQEALKEQKAENEANVKAHHNKPETLLRIATCVAFAGSATLGFAGNDGFNSIASKINIPKVSADHFKEITKAASEIANVGQNATPIFSDGKNAEISGTSAKQRMAESIVNRVDQETATANQKLEGQIRSSEQSEEKRSNTVLALFR